MRIINKFIAFTSALMLFTANVLAEDLTYLTTNNAVNEDDISITKTELTDRNDNSDMQIKVTKQAGEESNVIYTGALGEYDNGALVNVDFSVNDYVIVFEWGNDNAETVYIVSAEDEVNVKQDEQINDTKQYKAENSLTAYGGILQNSNIKCNVNLMYNGSYCERIMIKDRQISVPIEITNTSEEAENIVCYIGEYDMTGKLIGTLASTNISVESGQTITANMKKSFDDDAYSAKILIWDSETIRPITSSIYLNEISQDYYADSFSEAQIYDMNYYLSGNIDTTSDVDYIKFIPEVTGKYTFNCISTANTLLTLYNSNKTSLKTDASSFKYNLAANQTYYLKIENSDVTDEYMVSVQYNTAEEADSFSIYDFDIDTNIYKKSILNMCEYLYYDDVELSKQMYSEYEGILNKETKLHELPDFLAGHPKELDNFDDIVNRYYSTKYESLIEIRQQYIELIDQYTENDLTTSQLQDNETESTDNNEDSYEYPIIGKYYPELYSTEEIEEGDTEVEANVLTSEQRAAASLTITGTTATTITYNAIFPSSGAKGNAIYLVDFNNANGLTTDYNVYGTNAIRRENGTYTISNLQPGGIYILEMLWSTDGGRNYGGENSVDRFVQLPCNTTETLQMYDGTGRVSAYLEPEDKALASNTDFNTWLDRMDKAYGAFRELTGYTPYNAQKIIMKSTRENLNEYFGNVDGENYWWITLGYYDYTRTFKYGKVFYQGQMRRLAQGDWGFIPIHEMSHTFDCDKWNFDSETLAQFKSYYICENLNAKIYEPCRFNNNGNGWYTGTNYYTLLKTDRYLDSYTNSFNKGYYASEGFAAILIEIQQKIGWEPFKKTFRYFSDLSYTQVPDSNGDKLKLFLTKLKDYSGKDVLSYISTRDKNIINNHYNITLDYVVPIVPITSVGDSAVISAEKGSCAVYTFTPTSSGNYYIYTSPYAESGISNDTYIEVYTDSAMTADSMIASNDDCDGRRFSKVNVAMTEDTDYYIKVRHYNSGKLFARINITKNAPIQPLTLNGYQDIITSYGEYELFSFTPDTTSTYVFEVENYNGGTNTYNTYIKLYDSISMTNRLGNGENKILANLKAGHTYYLQFSGYLMRYARGRITASQGQTLQFKKRSDSSFIYVNSPEYITRFDIVDDISHTQPVLDKTSAQPYMKLSEFENITGRNTFYETHTAWWGELVIAGNETYSYDPLQQFYMDIDMYNPTSSPITVSIENLAYGVSYSDLQQYYNGGYGYEFTIQPQEHIPIFSHINAPLLCREKDAGAWARIPVILFDFTVHSGNVTVSSIAAYNRNNLYLRNGTKNVVDNTGAVLNSGDVICAVDNYGNVAWGTLDDPRRNETDLYAKMKGIAINESAWIDSEIELVVDDNTELGTPIPLTLKDSYYTYGIANPKWSWKSSINPLNDAWDGVLTMLPNGLHNFNYHYNDTSRQWYFDFQHRDLRYCNINGSSTSVNNVVPSDIIDNAKRDMATGQKEHFADDEAPDKYSMSIGEWGATYHYTVTVKNTTSNNRTANVKMWSAENMIFGLKKQGETTYSTNYYAKIYNTPNNPANTATINIPANSTTTFEFVTLLGGGLGGLNHSIVIE